MPLYFQIMKITLDFVLITMSLLNILLSYQLTLLALTTSVLREDNADVCLISIALIVIMKMTGDKQIYVHYDIRLMGYVDVESFSLVNFSQTIFIECLLSS